MSFGNDNCTLEELLVANVAKELEEGEVGCIGLGIGAEAFILTVGIPAVACRLAQLTHAPNFTTMMGPIINPEIKKFPKIITDANLINWSSQAQIPVQDHLDMWQREKIDIGFISGAQIDQYGNVNAVCIGAHDKPLVRLVGPIAQTNYAAFAKRCYIFMKHEERRFVEKVDFISGVGYLEGTDSRRESGLTRGRPTKVFTDLAVLDFDQDTLKMKVETLHPGVSLDEVKGQTGFDLVVPDDLSTTYEPTPEELNLIREIDPDGYLLKAKAK